VKERAIDRTHAAGWVVQLTVPGAAVEGSRWRGPPVQKAPSFQFFNVAIGSADEAVEAVRHKVRASEEAPIRVVRALSIAELAATGLRSGQIKPA
jgi:hypothetical protein